jgi:hypothetical protein
MTIITQSKNKPVPLRAYHYKAISMIMAFITTHFVATMIRMFVAFVATPFPIPTLATASLWSLHERHFAATIPIFTRPALAFSFASIASTIHLISCSVIMPAPMSASYARCISLPSQSFDLIVLFDMGIL